MVFCKTVSGSYSNTVDVGNVLTYTLTNLGAGTYYIAASAYDNSGNESGYSNEVSATIELEPPQDFRITWQGVTALGTSGATVAWQTNAECSGKIYYGTDPENLSPWTANNQGTYNHLVNITGLVPRTKYYYKLESVCEDVVLESQLYSFNSKAL